MKILRWIGVVVIAFLVLFFALSLTIGTQPDDGFMLDRIDEIESYLIHRDAINTEVSSVDVAWQLDHMLKGIINISQALEDSDPETYSLSFNIARTLFFTIGDFPRGVAQAPASVMPPDEITDEALMEQLSLARQKVGRLPELSKKSWFMHDTFGSLNRNHAARLLEVHTDHHLKIVRDILKAEGIK